MKKNAPDEGEPVDPFRGVLNSLAAAVVTAKVVQGNQEAAGLLEHLSLEHQEEFMQVLGVLHTLNVGGPRLVHLFKIRCKEDCKQFLRLMAHTHEMIVHAEVN